MSLPVRFTSQLRDGYCLPACVQMVLAALRIQTTQQQLARLLATSNTRTPFSRLGRLVSLGVRVEYGSNGTLDLLAASLAAATPSIVAVHAGWLPYARIETPRALVIVGMTSTVVTVLDPAAARGPLVVPIDAWLAAWVEMGCAYAIIKR